MGSITMKINDKLDSAFRTAVNRILGSYGGNITQGVVEGYMLLKKEHEKKKKAK